MTLTSTSTTWTPAWTGAWVAEHAGVRLSSADGRPVDALVGLALRRNPKRLHLVVSNVLAKHVPVAPGAARAHGAALGDLVTGALGPDSPPVDLVIGYAETATGLGHLVADRLDAVGIHSTRRPGWSALSFEEEHSHATTHRLQPADRALLAGAGPLVLVDDELTTGTTILNTVRELHAISPRAQYVAAALVDFRPADARARAEEVAAELGTSISFVALMDGVVRHDHAPDGVARAALAADDDWALAPDRAHEVWVDVEWPDGVPLGGRHGLAPHDRDVAAGVQAVSARVAPHLGDGPVHVLGTEELMYLPLRLAEELDARTQQPVTLSSTTRSPVLVLDDPGYAVRHGLRFAAHDGVDEGSPRFAYNLTPGRFDTIVLVLDDATPAGGAAALRRALRGCCSRLVVVRLEERLDA